MGKSMTVGLLGVALLFCEYPWHQAAAQENSRTKFPKACHFFSPRKVSSDELAEERAYDGSVAEVYRLWCTPNRGTINERKAAANEMVKRWKAAWERDDPYDAAFHEMAAFDLLALLGVTYELPTAMASDPKLIQEWTEDCQQTCFTIWGDPSKPADQEGILKLLQLRNDVIDHLKKEPVADPIFDMLWQAEFTLEH